MIEIRNIKHTKLNLRALTKLVQKYAHSLKLKKDIVVAFDKRLTGAMGACHQLDTKSQRHIIQIYPSCEGYKEESSIKYSLLAYVLHELKHAQQIEVHGYQYHHKSKEFALVEEIKDKQLSAFYSKCELEARMYESKHLHAAVDYYNKHVLE